MARRTYGVLRPTEVEGIESSVEGIDGQHSTGRSLPSLGADELSHDQGWDKIEKAAASN